MDKVEYGVAYGSLHDDSRKQVLSTAPVTHPVCSTTRLVKMFLQHGDAPPPLRQVGLGLMELIEGMAIQWKHPQWHVGRRGQKSEEKGCQPGQLGRATPPAAREAAWLPKGTAPVRRGGRIPAVPLNDWNSASPAHRHHHASPCLQKQGV